MSDKDSAETQNGTHIEHPRHYVQASRVPRYDKKDPPHPLLV